MLWPWSAAAAVYNSSLRQLLLRGQRSVQCGARILNYHIVSDDSGGYLCFTCDEKWWVTNDQWDMSISECISSTFNMNYIVDLQRYYIYTNIVLRYYVCIVLKADLHFTLLAEFMNLFAFEQWTSLLVRLVCVCFPCWLCINNYCFI